VRIAGDIVVAGERGRGIPRPGDAADVRVGVLAVLVAGPSAVGVISSPFAQPAVRTPARSAAAVPATPCAFAADAAASVGEGGGFVAEGFAGFFHAGDVFF